MQFLNKPLLWIMVLLSISVLGQNNIPRPAKKPSIHPCDSLLRVDVQAGIGCWEEAYKKNPLGNAYEKLFEAYLMVDDSASTYKLAKRQVRNYGNARPNYYVDYYVFAQALGRKGPEWVEIEDLVRRNPHGVRMATRRLEYFNELQKAIDLMLLAERTQPQVNTSFERAQLHAQLGQFHEQYDAYITSIELNKSYLSTVQMRISQNLSDDPEGPHNAAVKEVLYERIRTKNDPVHEQLLLYVLKQEGSFRKAYSYLKAKSKADVNALRQILQLGKEAAEAEKWGLVEEIYGFLLDGHEGYLIRSQSLGEVLVGRHKNAMHLADGMAVQGALERDYPLGRCEECFGWELHRGWSVYLKTLVDGARNDGALDEYLAELEAVRRLYPREKYKGRTYIRSGMAHLNHGYYDNALLDYARAESLLGDSPEGDEARYQKALCAFYRGDLNWAKTQVEVLLRSTSKAIANDAMELALLITSNSVEDTAMEGLMLMRLPMQLEAQGLVDSALVVYEEVAEVLLAHELYDDVQFRIGQLKMQQKNFADAAAHFKNIVQAPGDGMWKEDALFYLAKSYALSKNELASSALEDYLIAYPNGIFGEEARALYRTFTP